MSEYVTLVESERTARSSAATVDSPTTQALATLSKDRLQELGDLVERARDALYAMDLADDISQWSAEDWRVRAIEDQLAGRNAALWEQLTVVADEPVGIQQQLDAQEADVIDVSAVLSMGLGPATGQLAAGRQLLDRLESGRKLRTVLPALSSQRAAAPLLSGSTVNGSAPRTADRLRAVLERLDIETAIARLQERWALVGVEFAGEQPTQVLSRLLDRSRQLGYVATLVATQRETLDLLSTVRARIPLTTPEQFLALLAAIPAAHRVAASEQARNQLDELGERVRAAATCADACPELSSVLDAVAARSTDGYQAALASLATARDERSRTLRLGQLERTLTSVHPGLLQLLKHTATEPVWEERLAQVGDAWAWRKAEEFCGAQRTAEREQLLLREREENTHRQTRVTAELAATMGLSECMWRMTDEHARALSSYRQHMGQIGAGYGKQVKRLRRAARSAMHKAKDAVPAWVVPLPRLLETIEAQRDAFDVVIVDEASQAGLERLFLLWMAPRVIVVGDDKQCAPSDSRLGPLESAFTKLDDHLPELDRDVREHFTPKSSLYGVLSARAGTRNVIRLREHFRCMPEIIGWSSGQFYTDPDGRGGLVPLRQFGADRLEPVKVTRVPDGVTEGRDIRRRNPGEAKAIVQQLVECLGSPRYAGKSFGIVVLQGTGQVQLLEHEINASVQPEVRQERRIRVGTPANFQGDERDVIFLSMVVAEPPRASKAIPYQHAYNVAASRARDQVWLFTSVGLDQLQPDDLRASLQGYLEDPPSPYGSVPPLENVHEDEPHEAFDSGFERRVFREIRLRGYQVVPQYQVGDYRLDLVISGGNGRIAVECDGHRWHTDPDDQRRDLARQQKLQRAGWEIVRIRESEFEFNRERALGPVWERLDQRGITPRPAAAESTGSTTSWRPVPLEED